MGRRYKMPHYDRCWPLARNAIYLGQCTLSKVWEAYPHLLAEGPPGVQRALPALLENETRRKLTDYFLEARGVRPAAFLDEAYEGTGATPQDREREVRAAMHLHDAWKAYLGLGLAHPMLSAGPGSPARGFANYAFAEAVATHTYDAFGRQVYSLSPLIAEMFEHTDLGALTLADVHLPFGCFYVSLEGSSCAPLDGFYVCQRHDREGDVLSFVGVGFGDEKKGGCLNEAWPDRLIITDEDRKMERDGYFRYFFEIQTSQRYGYGPNDNPSCWRDVPLDTVIDRVHTHPDLQHQTSNLRGNAHPGRMDGPAVRLIEQSAVGSDGERPHDALSRYMVKMAMSLLLYLNSDDRSVVTTSEREEVARVEREAATGRGKRGRKRRKAREAKERRKYMSTATVTRVGVREEAEIRARPGFSMDQPRHWRRGHFHRYWTGPVKVGGARIPYEEWAAKRTIVRQWLIPTLINPEGEREDVTTRTVVKEAQEALANEVLTEGKLKDHKQSARERNPKARRKCLEHHGRICQLCSDDGSRFGEGAKGWLHVHHIDPLGDAVAERDVDPIADLVPLCGACHGFVHSKRPAITMERAREIIAAARAAK